MRTTHPSTVFTPSVLFAIVALGCMPSGGCARGERADQRAPAAEQPKPISTELVVFAAASLRDAFTQIGEQFERDHPQVEIVYNFAGSQELRAQIEHGAAADVLAAADQRRVAALAQQGKLEPARVFAHNLPVIVVPKGNPAAVGSLQDLPKAERLVIGAPDVPIGSYTVRILDNAAGRYGADFRARVAARVVSHELNVRQVLAKVVLGEADAAIVYRSDALAAGDKVAVVTIDPELNVIAEYPIAVVEGAPHAELARAFVAAVRSPAGQSALERAGFTAAPGLGTSAP